MMMSSQSNCAVKKIESVSMAKKETREREAERTEYLTTSIGTSEKQIAQPAQIRVARGRKTTISENSESGTDAQINIIKSQQSAAFRSSASDFWANGCGSKDCVSDGEKKNA
jgi:hypothetical protein